MTNPADYKPRFSFEISEEQMLRANKLLEQYGLRKAIFSRLLDEVLDLIDSYGGLAIGVMLSDATKLREIIPAMKHVEEVTKKKESKKGKDNG